MLGLEGFLEALLLEDERYVHELLGLKLILVKAEHQLFMLTIAQICLKENHKSFAEKAIALDLRMKIFNNEMGEF